MPDQSEAPIVRPITERLRSRVKIETACGNRTENPNNHVRLMDEAAEIIRLCEEAFFGIADRAPERDLKWAGMTTRDIALWGLAQIKGQNP